VCETFWKDQGGKSKKCLVGLRGYIHGTPAAGWGVRFGF
jgi:hypothetical protein